MCNGMGYSASLDGITLEGDLILEVKCPLRGSRSDLWQDVIKGRVPDHYQVQLQHQLMVAGARTAHLWVFDGAKGVLLEVARDEAWMLRLRGGWEWFHPFLDTDTPPPLSEGDTRQRNDAEWQQAAKAFCEAKQRMEACTAALDEAREALMKLAEHPKEQGAGVTVTRYWRQGSVDYKRVPQLQGVDLEPYRKKAAPEVRVTIAP